MKANIPIIIDTNSKIRELAEAYDKLTEYMIEDSKGPNIFLNMDYLILDMIMNKINIAMHPGFRTK